MWKRLLQFYFCFSSIALIAQETDSISKNFNISITASCAVTGQKNWNGNSESVLALNTGVDLRYQHQNKDINTNHTFRGSIGYFKTGNDQWAKSNDQLLLNFSWFRKNDKFWCRGFTGALSTQWLSSYSFDFEKKNQSWTGGFMNPVTLDASYDFSHSFGKNSRIILSPATISVSATPGIQDPSTTIDVLFETKHSYIRSRYGCSLQLSMYETFNDGNILIDNRSCIIANSISPAGIKLYFENRIAVQLFRYLQLRLDTGVQYNPLLSLKMQLRQEVLLGVLFEKEK